MRAGQCRSLAWVVAAGVAVGAAPSVGAAPASESAPAEGTFFVAPGGSDDPRNGSEQRPWATITYAVKRVPDGSTIVVRPGTYFGRLSLDRRFVKGVIIRAQIPYRSLLRQRGRVISCYRCQGVSIEGFDVAHAGPGAQPLVIQIDGGAELGGAANVALRNNVIHDSHNNDLLKVNNGARRILVKGNVFYNQQGRDEHIDVNSAAEVLIEDNVFFNDFAGSGRPLHADTGSFIVVKDSNAEEDALVGSEDIRIRRNVFLGWQGGRAYGFLLLGEDGKSYFEARRVVIENNLMLGDSPFAMRAPLGVKGCKDTVFRNNTVVGELPANAFAARINREGRNAPGDGIHFYNNVWASPSGAMDDFTDSESDHVGAFVLSNNLYWNGGRPIPASGDDAINYTADRARVLADPELRDPRDLLAPRWVPERATFADGSRSVEEVRLRLIDRFARPFRRSAVIDRANASHAPEDDIRGRPRDRSPDIGAFEVDPAPPTRAAARPPRRR